MSNTPDSWAYKLPAFIDEDGDPVTVTPDFGAANFVFLKDGWVQVDDISTSLSSITRPGAYFLKYILSDGKDSATFSQLLLVNAAPQIVQA